MDAQQLLQLYRESIMYMYNPPSFDTWCRNREQREAYEKRQEGIKNSPPDEDAWNK